MTQVQVSGEVDVVTLTGDMTHDTSHCCDFRHLLLETEFITTQYHNSDGKTRVSFCTAFWSCDIEGKEETIFNF